MLSVSGCYFFSPSQNPAEIWWGLLPNGGIYQTHAKPAGKGYYHNFDPYACRIELRPKLNTQPVGGTQVYVATVYDAQGIARRGRRVEWLVEGKGNIIEVDEGGVHPDRGYKVTEKYAVSYTDYLEHTFDRGTKDPSDDFVIHPGQTFCIVSSPFEGETKVTAYVPAMNKWDENRVTVTTFWLDAAWIYPIPQQARKEAQLTTKVVKASDRQPLQGYRIRYKLLDGGPPAAFVGGNGREADAITDPMGNGTVVLRQLSRDVGVSRVGIEIIRPPDAGTVAGAGIVVGQGETTVEWTGSGIALGKIGPPVVAANSTYTYSITVTNTSRGPSDPLTVEDLLPDGITYVSSDPPATPQENRLIWTLPPLPPGAAKIITMQARASRTGTFNNQVRVIDADRSVAAETFASTAVTAPGLKVRMSAPANAFVGSTVDFTVSVENSGDAPANNVYVVDTFDDGLVYEPFPNQREFELNYATLAPKEVKTQVLKLKAVKPGTFTNRVKATADGGLLDQTTAQVNVTRIGLGLNQRGPQARYVRGKIIWEINVENTNAQPVDNVVVHDTLPPQVIYKASTNNGQVAGNNEIVWNLGVLEAGGKRKLMVEVEAKDVAPKATNHVVATFGPNLQEKSEADVEIRGIPALLMLAEQTDRKGTIRQGESTTYVVTLNNTGSQRVGKLVVQVKTSPELKVVRAIGPDGTAAQIQGDTITFKQMDDLIPSQQFSYTLEVEGVAAGDGRINIQYTSDLTGKEPVKDSEQLSVIK